MQINTITYSKNETESALETTAAAAPNLIPLSLERATAFG